MATIDRSAAASPNSQSLHPASRHRLTDSPTHYEDKTPNEMEAEERRLLEAVQDYKLPQAVQASLGSWTKGANSLAVIMVLFAGVQMTLIQLVIQQDQSARDEFQANPTGEPFSDPTQTLPWRVMRWFMYAGVAIDLGGTASSVSLINMASAGPIVSRTNALRDPHCFSRKVIEGEPIKKELLLDAQEVVLLRQFGLSKWFNRVAWHMLLSFVFGSLCLLISLCIWIWITEPSTLVFAFIL